MVLEWLGPDPGLPVHERSAGLIRKMSRNSIRIHFPAVGLDAFSVAAFPVTSLIIMEIRALNNPDYNPVRSDLLAKCSAVSLALYILILFIYLKRHACPPPQSPQKNHAGLEATAKGPSQG